MLANIIIQGFVILTSKMSAIKFSQMSTITISEMWVIIDSRHVSKYIVEVLATKDCSNNRWERKKDETYA